MTHLPGFYKHPSLEIVCRKAKTIYARNRSYDDNILALEKALGGTMPKRVKLIVYGRRLGDVHV